MARNHVKNVPRKLLGNHSLPGDYAPGNLGQSQQLKLIKHMSILFAVYSMLTLFIVCQFQTNVSFLNTMEITKPEVIKMERWPEMG